MWECRERLALNLLRWLCYNRSMNSALRTFFRKTRTVPVVLGVATGVGVMLTTTNFAGAALTTFAVAVIAGLARPSRSKEGRLADPA